MQIANDVQQTLARAQAINEEHATSIRQLEGEPNVDTSSPSALGGIAGVDVEAVDSGVAEATAVAAEETSTILARIEMQLPAFLEKQRATAQAQAVAAAGRDARPRRFFGRVMDKVKERFSGLMA